MPFSLRRSAWFCLFILSFTLGAHAQDTWSSVTNATAADLWGICWGDHKFVAVGQSGTVLTSDDGTSWTSRTSDSTEWLLAVTYSADLKLYVVVGDHGTVLTSTDAVTWTAHSAGTTERLNGIAAGGGRLVAVGEHGTVATSVDGAVWTVTTVPASGWLRGVAYAAEHFLIGGGGYPPDAPPMPNYVTSDGRTFSAVPDNPWGGACEAIAVNDSEVIALSGFIALSPAVYPLRFRTLYQPPPDATLAWFWSYLRGILVFNGTYIGVGTGGVIVHAPIYASGGKAEGFEIDRDFTAIAGNEHVAIAVGTHGTIARTTATPAAAPSLSAFGTPLLQSANLGSSVTLRANVSGSPPMTVQWYRNGQAIWPGDTQTLTLSNLQPSDSGTYALMAANPLGSKWLTFQVVVVSPVDVPIVDPTFNAAVPVSAFAEQPDGRLIIATNAHAGSTWSVLRLDRFGNIDPSFSAYPIVALPEIALQSDGKIVLTVDGTPVRLNADGSIDSTFQPIVFSSGIAHQTLADGRILTCTLNGNVATLTRLNRDGTVDSTFSQAPVTLAPVSASVFDVSYGRAFITPAFDGTYLLAAISTVTSYGTMVTGRDQSKLLHLLADGSVDSSFRPTVIDTAIEAFAPTADFIYFIQAAAGPFGMPYYSVSRMDKNYTVDSSFRTTWELNDSPILLPDGESVFLQPTGNNSSHLGWYLFDGRLDLTRTFDLSLSGTQRQVAVRAGGGGHMFASGADMLNGQPTHGFARLTVDSFPAATRLINISARQTAGTGSATLTLGFGVVGQGHQSMLVRGVGPTLGVFGLKTAALDPTLTLLDGNRHILATNDNWDVGENPSRIEQLSTSVGAFALASGSRDAATVFDLSEGTYSVQINSKTGDGIALAEGYDTTAGSSDNSAARLVNFSSRALAGTGDATLIVGFTIDGPGAKRVLIRASGPSLTPFGVEGALANPVLTVFKHDTVIGWNDDWQDYDAASGAFPFTSPKDASLILKLPAGTYTAQVSSADGGTGIALVEVYELR
jgi:hypothetical protein